METGRNLLAGEASPYLLQHARNPVHWRPWGAAALAEAKRRDCPILLSIGYAACHWCHVMAHESFENDETAQRMNELFVNIKVDREERPDIDHIYMTALHAMGQQGGWPLTMFLTPEGQPMFGGTYWPPEPRWGRPSFRQVLESVDTAWRTRREEMKGRGLALADHLAKLSEARRRSRRDARRSDPDRRRALERGRPRAWRPPRRAEIPQRADLPLFLERDVPPPASRRSARPCAPMLEAMNAGGIYDHLGGGYARYSTDAEWLVPHFEKMLYDNAQILELLALVHSLWPDPTFADRARETVGWLMREMRVGDAFAASLDADQDGEEGLFYVWREDEIDAALGEAARRFKAAYDVTRGGNWEGQTVLRRVRPRGFARRGGRARRLAGETVRRARGAAEARPRRQGAGRLERPDHRRARPRERRVRRAGVACNRARRVRLHHDEAARAGRAASARLARGTSRRPRAPRRLRVDGPRRARPVRGERRAARPRGRPKPRDRGSGPVRRRRGRRLPHRERRRRRAGRASAPGA